MQLILVEPKLGGLQWMQGKVPTPSGNIEVYCSNKEIKVTGVNGAGTLKFKSSITPKSKVGSIKSIGNQVFELPILAGEEYIVTYQL